MLKDIFQRAVQSDAASPLLTITGGTIGAVVGQVVLGSTEAVVAGAVVGGISGIAASRVIDGCVGYFIDHRREGPEVL